MVKHTYGQSSKTKVVDSSVEGRMPETATIRSNGRVGGKKAAGNVGASNANHA